MATQLQIINLAFSHLGEPLVRDLDGDPPIPNVTKARAQWDMAIEEALSQGPWLCASVSSRIDADFQTPQEKAQDWRYTHRFTCPTGTLKVWNVEGGYAWQAGTAVDADGRVRRVIRANHPGPVLADVVRLVPVEALTPLLANALAWELAARLAGPIQSNEQKAKWAADKAVQAYARAAGSEMTEIGGQDPLIPMGSLQAARLSAP